MRRVAVTGLGVLSSLGKEIEEFWKNIQAGKSGISLITSFDTTDFSSRIASEIKDFDPLQYMGVREAKRMDRFAQFAVVTAQQALEESGLHINESNCTQVGVLVGSGVGGMHTFQEQCLRYQEKGPSKISPFFIPMMISNMASGQISINLGAKGPSSNAVTACAAAAHAIGEAYHIIKRGDAMAMICGGTEASITPLSMGGFSAMKALSTNNDQPEKACRPFDLNRDGFVMGEGTGILILESLEEALKRGAFIYGEIIGYGMSTDAYHITDPAPEGEGAARSMAMALKNAGILPDEVDYINAHGTSTPKNDKFETMAIKKIFGEKAYRIPVSSTKSMTGHLLGAAGGIETIISFLSIRDGILPPTINYETPDPECDLDYVVNTSRRGKVRVALSNSLGFGGHNATLVMKAYEG